MLRSDVVSVLSVVVTDEAGVRLLPVRNFNVETSAKRCSISLFQWMEVTAVTGTAISTLKSSNPCQATKRTAKNPAIWMEGAAAAASSAAEARSLEIVEMPL